MPHKVPTDSLPITRSPNVTTRPPKRGAQFDGTRAEARMIRQRLCEIEQELEDRDALKSHPEDMRILFESFASVKAEFQPLDGQSWDTPEGRERLARDEAARNRANHLTPARAHRLTSRRSRASIKPSTVTCRGNPTASRPELLPTTDAPDLSSDDITLSRPTTPSPPDADQDDSPSRDLQRTPLPSFYRARTDGDRMVISLEHPDDDADADTTFYAELATPQPLRADDQKSPWLMRVPRHPGRPVSPQKSPSRLPRPTGNRQVQARGTPSPVFSKPKSSATRSASSTAQISALRTPSKPAKIARTKSRTVLASSPTTNYSPVFTAPAPPGPGTTSRATSPQKRQAPGSSSATTRLSVAEAWWVEKSRPVRPETPSHSRILFPRTEDLAQSPTRRIPPRSQTPKYEPVFSRPSERSTASRPTSPSKRPINKTSTTTRRWGTELARSVDSEKSRPVKREPPSQSHTPVFFPRTEDPVESDSSTGTGTVEVGALPERHRAETIKASASRTRKSSQSHGSGSRAKAWV